MEMRERQESFVPACLCFGISILICFVFVLVFVSPACVLLSLCLYVCMGGRVPLAVLVVVGIGGGRESCVHTRVPVYENTFLVRFLAACLRAHS